MGLCLPRPHPPLPLKKKVMIGRSPWNYDIINARILQRTLEDKGYTVKMKDVLDLSMMFASIGKGHLDLYSGLILPMLHSTYLAENSGKILPLGDIYGAETLTRWTVPKYVVEKHGIRSYSDLKGKADIFDGKIYGYEAGTGGSEKSFLSVKEYGLENEYKFLTGSVASMFAELKSAVKRNKPVNASPNA